MLKYVELKSDQDDKGPAWIARVTLSKSGNTVYFNGMALKRASGVSGGNHVDLESGAEYWVSGVKKDGSDRHWAGAGMIAIEESAVPEYLTIVGKSTLDRNRLEMIPDLPETDIQRLYKLEN